jgi:hypothetical protein
MEVYEPKLGPILGIEAVQVNIKGAGLKHIPRIVYGTGADGRTKRYALLNEAFIPTPQDVALFYVRNRQIPIDASSRKYAGLELS